MTPQRSVALRSFSRIPLWGMVLACALLLGQLVLVVHAADHTWHPDRPVCQLCVHAHAATGAPPATPLRLPGLRMEPPAFALQPPRGAMRVCAYGARAPPI